MLRRNRSSNSSVAHDLFARDLVGYKKVTPAALGSVSLGGTRGQGGRLSTVLNEARLLRVYHVRTIGVQAVFGKDLGCNSGIYRIACASWYGHPPGESS